MIDHKSSEDTKKTNRVQAKNLTAQDIKKRNLIKGGFFGTLAIGVMHVFGLNPAHHFNIDQIYSSDSKSETNIEQHQQIQFKQQFLQNFKQIKADYLENLRRYLYNEEFKGDHSYTENEHIFTQSYLELFFSIGEEVSKEFDVSLDKLKLRKRFITEIDPVVQKIIANRIIELAGKKLDRFELFLKRLHSDMDITTSADPILKFGLCMFNNQEKPLKIWTIQVKD